VGFYLFCFYASNFRLPRPGPGDISSVHPGLRYGYFFFVGTTFRLLVVIRGDLGDLSPRDKDGSECMAWKKDR